MKKSILVIDDDVDILNIVAIILKSRGYEVVTDTTGSYIETMQSLPHMIILDIALNGYDGREICKKLKSLELTAAIPVMFLSANLDLHNICAEHKADDYLTKPFEIADLIKKVDKFMMAA